MYYVTCVSGLYLFNRIWTQLHSSVNLTLMKICICYCYKLLTYRAVQRLIFLIALIARLIILIVR